MKITKCRYVAELESRLRALESAAGLAEPTTTSITQEMQASQLISNTFDPIQIVYTPPYRQPPGQSLSPKSITNLGAPTSPYTSLSPGPTLPLYEKPTDYSRTGFHPDGVDAMGNLGAMESSYAEGSSSAASFAKQVKDAVASRLSLPGLGSKIVLKANESPFAQNIYSVAELYLLPSRRSADRMMDIYWNEVHILYPFLDRVSFSGSYNTLWSKDDDEQSPHMLFCHLNIIFALTCQLRRRVASDDGSNADVFFRRAAQLLQTNLLQGGSLEQIQACLLMTQYLQSTEWPQRCWVIMGLAIRVAQALGLHLEEFSSRLDNVKERELSRRVWHGCVFLDR